MRSILFRFDDIAGLSATTAEARGSLAVPEGESVADGEWVLAIFEIGSRKRATAVAARAVRAAGDTHLAFERRDWDRLLQFVMTRSEHMRTVRPVSGSPSLSGRPPPVESDAPPSSMLESRGPIRARVLLVHDDEQRREAIRLMLTDIGLVVDVVESAEDARSRMASSSFDALVVDLPASLEFTRHLKREPVRAPVPVLILSEQPSSKDVVDAFASGADDVLPKPFRAPELGARILGLLRRARPLTSLAPSGAPPGDREGTR